MANPYPADIQDGAGNVRISGKVNFTDPDNQPGGGASPLRVETVEIAYADFTLGGTDDFWFANVYTLQAGEQLLFTLGRVTEAFDDSLNPTFKLVDTTNHDTADEIGLSSGNLGPTLPPAAQGLITLTGISVGGVQWNEIDLPITPATAAVPLYLIGTLAKDGTTGAATLWLYIATP